MRICFYTSDICDLGGIDRATRIVAERLAEQQGQIGIVTLCRSEDGAELPKVIGDPYVQFDKRVTLKRVFFKCVRSLRAYLKENRSDVIVCTSEMLAPVCALAVKGLPTKYICWLHSNIDVYHEYSFQRQCRFIAAKTASAIISLTEEMMERLKRKYRINDVVCIPNPVDERLLLKPVNYRCDAKRIISVGRLCYAKNFELLADVAKIVLNKHPDWQWDIYGEGRHRESIEQRIAENGLIGRLNLMGVATDIYDRYGGYAMQVMTSRYEGFPMVLLEGMACGLPLVSFDITTGPNKIIRDGKNGFLVKPYDIEGMAAQICALMERPELRLSMSRQNELYRYEYGIDKIVKAWSELIHRIKPNA